MLRGFRITIDPQTGVTFWEGGPAPNPDDLDVVGLTLRPGPRGGFSVVGVARGNGAATVAGVVVRG